MEPRLQEAREQMDKHPLIVLDDQVQDWLTFGSDPIRLDEALDMVMQRHEADQHGDDLHIASMRGWAVVPIESTTLGLAPVPVPGARNLGPYKMRNTAFRQLCQRINVPSDYMLRLPPKLQLANLNWALTHDTAAKRDGKLRLAAGNQARALVSGRYGELDDRYVFDVINDVFEQAGLSRSARVRSVASGPTTCIRIVFPGESIEVREGDPIEFGLDLLNGEVGNRAVSISGVTYRLVCKNGMRAWKTEATTKLRHVGDASKLREAFRDAVPLVLAEARGQLEQWEKATSRMVDDVLADIDLLRGYGVTVSDTREVSSTLASDMQLYLPAKASPETIDEAFDGSCASVYTIANAITRTAQHKETDGRLALEEMAHRYLSRRVGQPRRIEV